MTRTEGRALRPVLTVGLILCLSALVAGGPAGAAFPDADGKIAFFSNRDAGGGEIYTISPAGGAATRITFPTGGNADPAFSPDGTRIAYVANSIGVDGGSDPEIWAVNADGSSQTRLTDNAFPDTQPAWSPLGNKIAFVSERRPAPFNDTNSNVYVMDADGGNQINLTPNQTEPAYQGPDENPDWSPKGDKIAYVHGHGATGGGLFDIWTMDPNTGANKTNVSNGEFTSETMPAWSPAGAG